MEHAHPCEFKPNGHGDCPKEATRRFRVEREYPRSGPPMGQELYICDEHIPKAKKLWEEQHMEWKEITVRQKGKKVRSQKKKKTTRKKAKSKKAGK